ncbi:mucoidy inhibitor MuiA family protein [Xanthobacteraceae bacterium Astr-EGSB]|uniref:mucoidy inhibitor MuiA family protein n=1 Tax=Astrobacterium formosum TaxID=3069710 RepID=UPI0027AE1BB6|nr:mucoidy inhibitor MuiA family protein [Xanthobacteraceae bacterium Astr-EGSB]
MRCLSAAAVLIFVGSAEAAVIDVNSAVDAVMVHPDGATVTRVIKTDLPAGDSVLTARDFPPGLDPASLRIEATAGSRVVIGAIDARPPRAERPPSAPELERQAEALKDERAALDDAIAAATARRKFVERFADSSPVGLGDKGEARPLAEWRAAFAAVGEEIAAVDGVIRDAKLRQRGIDRELARLEAAMKADPPRKMEVRIDLAAEAAANATLRVTYSVRGARWTPIYDARLDTGGAGKKPALELVRRAEIVQTSGEDWSDVALSVSTVRTAKGGAAPELKPLIVRYHEPPRPMARGALDKAAEFAPGRVGAPAPAAAPMAAREQEAEVDTSGFQVVFRIPGRVAVAAHEGAKSFRIASASIGPELTVRATPAIDDTAYLEAAFKHGEDAPLLAGRVLIYRDGIFVGRGRMPAAAREESVRLGFGADDKVKVTRAVVRKSEGSAGLIASSKTDEREFKITVKNGHSTAIRIAIEDQIPVSEIEDVKVETLPVTTQPTARDTRDRRGILEWTFDLAPSASRDIMLGWRVRWPADKSVIYLGRGM